MKVYNTAPTIEIVSNVERAEDTLQSVRGQPRIQAIHG